MKTTVLGCAALAFLIPAHAQNVERSGEQTVKAQCVKCHGAGMNGAPKIDDRAAWAPRMRQGLDATVRSAIRGHGKMPARGGMADLTDGELRAAISYMFYPRTEAQRNAPAEAPAARDPHLKLVEGMEVRLGVVPAEAASVQPKPNGQGNYYINISLLDAATKAEIRDAKVEARVAGPMFGETKRLNPLAANRALSYGNYFHVQGSDPQTISVKIQRPRELRPNEVTFDFRP